MKKLLFLLLLLFPFMVKAVDNVKITNIEELEKSDTVTVNHEPTFEGLRINFDFKFVNINDFIKYKVTIKNEDTKEYEIEAGVQFGEGEYIKYEFGLNGEEAIIKPNETKEMTLLITYTKEPAPSYFVDGAYVEQNAMSINLSTDNGQHNSVDPASQEDNPHTGAGNILIFITILLIAGVLLTVAIRKNDKVMLSLALLLIPISALAIEKITLDIETKIELEAVEKTFKVIEYGCFNDPDKEYEFKYRNGMTWAQFKASDYYAEARAKYTTEELSDELFEHLFPMSKFKYDESKTPQCYLDLKEPEFTEGMTEEEAQALIDAYEEQERQCNEQYPTRELEASDFILSNAEGFYYNSRECAV